MPHEQNSTVMSGFDHHKCFVCGPENADGLHLAFVREGAGVVAEFDPDPRFRSYPDRLHGGIIAMLLDDAMTNCLLQQGISAVTGRLNVTYRRPACLDQRAVVKAWIVSRSDDLYRMRAEFLQDDRVVARADGKFLLAATASEETMDDDDG